ncbi:MAG: hypothetical protein K2Z80_28750 [Xanthobacteraceae bacterium]|nr:hypothetical protein [Xanthobacteraceae bacterium]
MRENAGADVLLFGDAIGVSDIAISMSGSDLIVGIKDPANPGATFAQLTDRITLQAWMDALDRIEMFQLSDGTVLNLAGIIGRIGTDGVDTATWTETAVSLDAGAGNDSITTGSYNDVLRGGDGNDTLNAGGGDDVLAGGAGNDVLNGGSGMDTASYQGATAGVTVDLAISAAQNTQGAGTDTLSNIENLTGSLFDDQLNGSSGANVLTGLGGNDVLDGRAGADTMIGGLGDDTYVVDTASDTTVENQNEGIDAVLSSLTWTLANNVENLILSGTSAINGTGNSLDNSIVGNSANNVLYGLGGDDTLDGGAGADSLFGGAGTDTYVVDNAADLVSENSDEGIDTVRSSMAGTYTLGNNVENLILMGSGNTNGTGNSLDNVLTGNGGANTLVGGDGNDTLDGGAGEDSLSGGVGNDIYVVDNAGDTVAENANEGFDAVQSSITYALGAYVESLTLTGSEAINGTGNSLGNILNGNSGNNVLGGDDGNDTLSGGGGNDTLNGGAGFDSLYGDDGDDTLDGGAGDDALVGGPGADVYLFGSGGGQDQIANGVSGNAGPSGELRLSANIAVDQVWFQQSGNDLVAMLMGSQDRVTVSGWYANGYSQLNGIKTSDGQQIDTGLAQLVQAMATYSAQNAGFDPTASAQAPNDPTLQSAIAAAWH